MTVKKLVKLIRNDEGSGLVLALMTLMVFSILGVALGTITIGSYKLGDVNRDDNSAYYIAEAGANMAYEDIETIINTTYGDTSSPDGFFSSSLEKINNFYKNINYKYVSFDSQFGEQPEAIINVEMPESGDSREFKITSIGKIGNRERTVEKNVTVTWISKEINGPGYGSLPSTATVAKSELRIQGGVSVSGNVYLDSPTGTLSVIDRNINKNLDNLNVYVNSEIYERELENFKNSEIIIKKREQPFDWSVYTDLVGKFPVFPENPTYTEWPSTFDTTNGDISIVVDDLTLNQSQEIIIEGDGRVDIYVRNNLDIKGNVKINEYGDPDKLQLFYAGENDKIVSPDNNFIFNGSMFVKEADIDFSNGVKFKGVIVSGGDIVNLGKAEMNALVIAPSATIDLDTSSNTNSIKGIMVGNVVELKHGMSIEFSEYYLKNFPLRLPVTENDGDGSGGGSSEGDLIITEPGIEN